MKMSGSVTLIVCDHVSFESYCCYFTFVNIDLSHALDQYSLSTVVQKLKEVQEFLSLPTMDLTSRQIKIHSGPLLDHIKNWDDVLKTINGTSYEHFIHADY